MEKKPRPVLKRRKVPAKNRHYYTLEEAIECAQQHDYMAKSRFYERFPGAFNVLVRANVIDTYFPVKKKKQLFTLRVDQRPTLPQTWVTPLEDLIEK